MTANLHRWLGLYRFDAELGTFSDRLGVIMARLFFMAIPAFFAFLLTYIIFGADRDSAIAGLFIGAIIWQLGFEVTAPRKDRGEF